MITAITGGKGGVGKTTVSLIWAYREGASLLDADVETPNVHLFLGKGRPIGSLTLKRPHISDACVGCGVCVNRCPHQALVYGKPPQLLDDLCEGCGLCAVVCPVNAIDMKDKEVGQVYEIDGEIHAVYGELTGVVEETGGLIPQLYNYAGTGDWVVDTMPGIHCGVIRALAPAHKVVVVLEPTPLGLHDGEIMSQLLKEMGKKWGIVINKAKPSLYYDKIHEMAEKYDVPIYDEIPYSTELARAYARGEPFWKRF